MLNENSIKQIFAASFVALILVFVYLIIKPIFFSMIFGLLLAYSFNAPNQWLLKKVKIPTLSAGITCIITLAIIVVATWFLLPTLIVQTFDSYIALQSWDAISFAKTTFPFLFNDPQISANFEAMFNSLLSSTVNTSLSKLTEIISDLPTLILKILVVLIVFFYGLRDGDKILELLRDSLPFNKNVTNRFINKSKQVTFSVVFGRIIVGILTGILTGIGFFLIGIENSLLFTVLAIIASIIPIIGPWIVWIPIVVGLFVTDRVLAGIFLLLYGGIIVNLFETILHPIFVSRTSKIATSVTLIGIIGGLLVFGIFGLILGPLVMAYLTVLFELYRETKTSK
jgi:predicted PurR-regulated permease PerM